MMFRQKISQQSRYQKDSFRTLSDTKWREMAVIVVNIRVSGPYPD